LAIPFDSRDLPAAIRRDPRTWKAAAWFTLAVAGQAAAFGLVDAGTQIRYQHYRLDPLSLGADWWKWAILALQAALVLAGARAALNGPPWPLSRTRIALALGALWATGAIISRDLWKYPLELSVATVVQLTAFGSVALGVASMPSVGTRVSRWGRRLAAAVPATGTSQATRVVGLAALFAIGLSAALSLFVYQRHPHLGDELVYLLPARYFAEGRLWLPLPPAGRAFDLDLMHVDGSRWFSPVPPGWPAILSLGAALGLPWLVNPVLTGLNVWLTWSVLRRVYTEPVAVLTALLMSLSPWHLFLGMSFMTHTATLTCALVAAFFIARGHETGRLRWLAIAGSAAGLASLIRPLDGLATALMVGLLSLTVGPRRINIAAGAAFALGFAFSAALVLPYNAALTGDPRLFPIMAYADKHYWPNANAIGFGPERGLGWAIDPRPGHSPAEAVVNTLVNLSQVNTEMLGWAAGSFLGILALFVLGRFTLPDMFMVAAVGTIVGLHAFYWYSGGPDFGARYWFLAIVPLLALTARGIQELERAFAARHDRHAGRTLLGVLVLAVTATLLFIPWRAADKYWHFRGMRPDVRDLAVEHGFGRSLVLVRGNRFPDYASAAAYNSLDVQTTSGPVYVWDRDTDARKAALRAFPDRPVWIVTGPSLTGRGYEVSAGPLPAGEF
jgi:hypothetical protein